MLLPTLLLVAIAQPGAPPLTAPEILQRVVQADKDRLTALAGYSVVQHYRFGNTESGKTAEMTVRMSCSPDGVKTSEILSESGSAFVRSHILRKMIEAETEASLKGERRENRFSPENYESRLIRTEIWEGRESYVLEVNPRKPSKFSIRGRIWVDAADFAIARIEGQPARSPSFWVRSATVDLRYGRTGRFWLPYLNRSVAQARIFGFTEVVIEYSDYRTSLRQEEARVRPAGH